MAAEFKFPNEIDPLGSNLNKALDFQRMPTGKQRQISVRVGEIIRGKIVEVISPQQAVISLPDGTFTAEITGKFKSGDELFFRVQSTEPSLVLKIHSMFVGKENQELPISEILRILDLPKANLFEKIVGIEKDKSNIILREEVILKAKYANNLLEKFPKENLEIIIRFIDFSLENNLVPTKELFENFKMMYSLKGLLDKIFTILAKQTELLPGDLRAKLQEQKNFLQQKPALPVLLKFFSPNFSHIEDNFFNYLLRLRNVDIPSEVKIIFEELWNMFNGFWIVNASASLSFGNVIYFIIPYIWEKNFSFTLVRYRKRKQSNTETLLLSLEDEEQIQPIWENLEKELAQYFSSSEGRNEFNSMQNNFKKNSRKDGLRLIVKTPTGYTQVVRLLSSPSESQSSVSIVI